MAKYLLGIDNGGTVTKAAIYDLHGGEVAVSSCKTKLIMPEPGFTERDMDELRAANINVIRDVIGNSGIDPDCIVGVSVAGHGNGMYLIDESGKAVCNGIISTDTRAREFVDKWYSDGTADKIRNKTLQSIYAGQPVALLAWFKKYKPGAIEKARWILMCKDYIRFCLTGEVYAEITDISVANLLNVREKRYDEDLLSEFGLEDIINKLAPIKYSSDICGYITKEVASLTGLKEGTPVAGGMCDMDACAIATGIVDEESFCIIAGTWSINQYISRQPVVSKNLFLSSIYCIEGFWLNTEASATSASNLEWYVEQFLGEDKRIAQEKKVSVYKICDEIVAETKPDDSNVLFIPFLFGTNAGPSAKASFIGLSGWHSKAHMLRAIFEGIVFCHLDHINRLLVNRPRPKSIRISGGAARSRVWVQIFADILQIDIEVVKGTELGSFGSAICAGVSTDHFDSYESAIGAMVDIAYICKPNQDKKDVYARKYSLYKKAIEILSPLWDEFEG